MAHVEVDFLSYTLGRSVPLMAVIPSAAANDLEEHRQNQYRDLPPFPTLYLLHGTLNHQATWVQYTSVERYAEERQIAIVAMAGENQGYLNQGKGRYYDFLEDEVIPFAERMFPLSTRREDRFLAGLSMGGFGAYFHGLKNPDKYGALGSFSGVLSSKRPEFGDLPPLAVLKEDLRKGVGIPPLYLAIGTEDFLLKDNQAFLRYCQKAGIHVHADILKGYGHEWSFWDLAVRRFLDWLPRSDAYAGKRRRI